MLIAIPIWEGRVSPVFDVAQRLTLSTVEAGKIMSATETAIPFQDVPQRVDWLAQQKVDVLLCGAISGCIRNLLEERGIRVTPYVCGPVEQALAAFLEDRLVECGLVMPGCGCGGRPGSGGRRRRRRGWCSSRQEPERPER